MRGFPFNGKGNRLTADDEKDEYERSVEVFRSHGLHVGVVFGGVY